MRKIDLIGLVGVWALSIAVCSAQMSTFPSPPPLAPASKGVPDQTTNSPSNTPTILDIGPSSQEASGNSTESVPASSSQNAASVNAANTVPVTAATLSSMAALDDKITLEPGDRISVRVIEDRDEAVPRIVTDTGEVDFPYIGRLKVEGQSCLQVAIQLKRLLEVDYYKKATVIIGLDVIVSHPIPVTPTIHEVAWVVGQVHQVGPQELSKLQPITVSQIILRAGGFGDFADQRKVRIVHRAALSSTPTTSEPPNISNTQDGQIVDVKAVFEGQSTLDPIVHPDDYIIVPKRLINF
jgi:protein involved in polysaccharide export with SLBB domain